MKTLKEIADELGVSKQRVYRFVKSEHINEVHHEAHQSKSVKYYDEAAETAIKSYFQGKTQLDEVHHEVHHETDEAHHDAEVERLMHIIETMTAAHTAEVQRLTAELDQLRHDLNEERQHSHAQSDTLAQLADQAQRLQLAQMQPPALLDQKPPRSLWQRIFGKRTRHNDDTE